MSTTFFQFDNCRRQHNGVGGLIPAQLGIPESAICGRANCGAVAAASLAEEPAQRRAAMARPKATVPQPKPKRAAEVRSSCPADTGVIGKNRAKFLATGGSENTDARCLVLLQEHLRKWLEGTNIEQVTRTRVFHVRASSLRRKLLPKWDVDSRLEHNTQLPAAQTSINLSRPKKRATGRPRMRFE